jgi:hypothetical protein
MPSLRSALARLFGRPTGTIIVPPDIDEATLAALAAGELTPSFPHDAVVGTTCGLGWHLRRTTIGEAFAMMQAATEGRRGKIWFRLPARSSEGPVTPETVGELFRFGAVLKDNVATRTSPWFCDACGRAVGA